MELLAEVFEGLRNTFDFVSGANDVIVVRHSDGGVTCSTFAVQTSAHTINRHLLGEAVEVHLNGRLTNLQMMIGNDGRCVFKDGTYTPPPQELAALPLRDGRNSLDFRVKNQILSNAGIFSWKWTDRVVIVDIDGTVTRTDSGGVLASSELGQTLGLAHAHKGVCAAMSQIASAGYRLLFLTARPITRSEATRKYLATIGHEEASGKMMPEGALITSAMGTLGTMASVWKDLKAYKLSSLEMIQSLFDGGLAMYGQRKQSCFAGGFGNHTYDTDAYADAGCPKNRIFMIDEDSRISVPGSEVSFDGYVGLQAYIPDLFPPVVVVNWQAKGAFYGESAPLPPSHEGGPKRPLSLNKIPVVAYIGEGLGKVWGNVASTTTQVGSSVGSGLQQLPGADQVQKGLGIVEFPKMPKMAEEAAQAPPYESLEAHGLVDMGE